jgi:hypothetical protein
MEGENSFDRGFENPARRLDDKAIVKYFDVEQIAPLSEQSYRILVDTDPILGKYVQRVMGTVEHENQQNLKIALMAVTNLMSYGMPKFLKEYGEAFFKTFDRDFQGKLYYGWQHDCRSGGIDHRVRNDPYTEQIFSEMKNDSPVLYDRLTALMELDMNGGRIMGASDYSKMVDRKRIRRAVAGLYKLITGAKEIKELEEWTASEPFVKNQRKK